ncbi:hypothetical protein [Actinoplanes sp. NBRC 101535]|uniref:hypothetical protein n=1 Tax=Actinoplanes sp. NBRC 101535 TaxID=3032196 RepID=UPI00249FCF3A|nr:hypothetical protein [Actinoplanes sp. NBRC 101535]GLY06378.1 hypothetical protein Acsp01_67570 [Actinoplanes sp. NBRC 101535]
MPDRPPTGRAARRRTRHEVQAVPMDGGRRPWRDHAATGAVILVGIIAVVSFGLVVLDTSRPNPPPPAGPPVDGLAATPGPQIPIPLGSASVAPSFVSIDSVSIERSAVPEAVDLTEEGVADWVHWGEQGRYAMDRNAAGGFAILEGTPGTARERHTLSPERFSWTGGKPLAAATGVTSGARVCGAGQGFTLSAPAGSGISILRLYVGLAAAEGELRLKLSTGGETVTDSWEHRGTGLKTAAYTVHYSATRPGKISVEWITRQSFDEDCGGVALQAATLS